MSIKNLLTTDGERDSRKLIIMKCLVCVQGAWMLKMHALTEQLYVDEVDIDEEGIAETLMDSNAIANVPRPGTSLKQPSTGSGAISRGVRCNIRELYSLHCKEYTYVI